MKASIKYLLYLLVFIPYLSWGNAIMSDLAKAKQGLSLLNSPSFTSEGGRLYHFNHKAYASFGYRNLMFDYNGTVQFKRWFEVGGGVGYHHNSVKFYSASDKHVVGISSIPTYLTATIYPYHDDNRAFYIKGNYGFTTSFNGGKNKRDKSFNGKMIQGGVGYKQFIDRIDRSVYVELSQYYSTAKGAYNDSETYNAAIDYNLQFYGIVLSVGVNINSF